MLVNLFVYGRNATIIHSDLLGHFCCSIPLVSEIDYTDCSKVFIESNRSRKDERLPVAFFQPPRPRFTAKCCCDAGMYYGCVEASAIMSIFVGGEWSGAVHLPNREAVIKHENCHRDDYKKAFYDALAGYTHRGPFSSREECVRTMNQAITDITTTLKKWLARYGDGHADPKYLPNRECSAEGHWRL